MPSGVCHVRVSGSLPLSSFVAAARQSSWFVTGSSVGSRLVSPRIQVVLLTVPIGDAEVAADALWQGGTSAGEERRGPPSAPATLVADAPPSSVPPGWTLESALVDDGLDAWRAPAQAWVGGPFTVRPPWL